MNKTIEIYSVGQLKTYDKKNIKIEPYFSENCQKWGIGVFELKDKNRNFLTQIDVTQFCKTKQVYFMYKKHALNKAILILDKVLNDEITRL